MLGIAIRSIQHSQAMLERGVCELAHSFFNNLLGHRLHVDLGPQYLLVVVQGD